MTHQDPNQMCTSLDCPERTGGECNFETPLLEELLENLRELYLTKSPCDDGEFTISQSFNWARFSVEQREEKISFYLASQSSIEDFLTTTYKRIKEEGRREGVEECEKILTTGWKTEEYQNVTWSLLDIVNAINSLKSKK